MEILVTKLKSLASATEKSVEIMAALFTPFVYRKKMNLFVPQHTGTRLFFIETGAIRGFFIYSGTEYTSWLMTDEQFLLPSAKRKIKTRVEEHIEFLEGTTGWSLNLEQAILAAQAEPEIYQMLMQIYHDFIRNNHRMN